MQTTTTNLPQSRVQIEFELPPERLTRAIEAAVRRLSREAHISGFRPGKAPRAMLERFLGPNTILDEAVEQLVDEAFREAMRESDLAPLTSPEVDVTQAEEGKPLIFKTIVQVRPEVTLGAYDDFKFKPEVNAVDQTMVDKVVDELRDAEGHLEPVSGRGAKKGDYAVIGFVGTRDGVPFDGGTSERMPLVMGDDRLIPGFEDHLVGAEKGETREFDIVFPDDYQEETLRGQTAHFSVEVKELREKILPVADDEFARSVGKFADMAELEAELRKRLEENALDHARHEFADKIIEYATANATVEPPEVLIDQEVEVMHDELKAALARQGIGRRGLSQGRRQDYGGTPRRVPAPGREASEDAPGSVRDRQGQGRGSPRRRTSRPRSTRPGCAMRKTQSMVRYFESERGRNYIRSTIRRSRTVEQLVDEWLDAHPDAPRMHASRGRRRETHPSAPSRGQAAASVGATDPGSLAPSTSAPAGA